MIDSYNALTVDRPYRQALSPIEAFISLDLESKNGKFNKYLYNEFKDVFQKTNLNNIAFDISEVMN